MKNQTADIPGCAVGLPMLQHGGSSPDKEWVPLPVLSGKEPATQSGCTLRRVSRPITLHRLARGYRGRVGGLAATEWTAKLRRIAWV